MSSSLSVPVLDVPVSLYNGVRDNQGTVVNLSRFLNSRRHIDRIKALRMERDPEKRKQMKISLPMATVSGVFSPVRSIGNLKSHSGLLCIDLDAKQNPGHELSAMRRVLESREDTAYVSLSVSGNGLFAIIPLAYPDRQREQFSALKREFKTRYDLVLDDCGDVTRLRALSYDPEPCVNAFAMRYEGIDRQELRVPAHSLTGADGDMRKVNRCVEQIVRYGIDITGSYEEWVAIGMSLCSLGEQGRYYFHAVSRQYPNYQFGETDRKFTALLRGTKRVGLGTFFYWCSQYGVTYKKENNSP